MTEIKDKLVKWVRYFSYVRPTTIFGRIFHTIHCKAISLAPQHFIKPSTIENEPFKNLFIQKFSKIYKPIGDRFTTLSTLYDGTFESKGIRHDFGSLENLDFNYPFPKNPDYINWWHDLCFFSFAIKLVDQDGAHGLKLVSKLLQIMETVHPIGNGKFHFVWTPIALSIRIMALSTAGALAVKRGIADCDTELDILAKHIAYCSSLLLITQESYLRYNHQVFGVTALSCADMAVLGCKNQKHFSHECVTSIIRHVPEDGFWEERSPTYHIHMLLLTQALLASGYLIPDAQKPLETCAKKMQEALNVLVHSDGEIAIYNDSAMQDSVPPASVGWRQSNSTQSLTILPNAGFAQIKHNEMSIIFDAGKMGPDDVIGHGHADFLALEIAIGNSRLIVDPGVASISAGSKRDWTRSAQSHNGPTYVGLEPAEFFGAWRVGYRGKADFVPENLLPADFPQQVAGWADGYDRFGGRVARSVGVSTRGAVFINDYWKAGPGLVPSVSFLIPSTWSLTQISETELQLICDSKNYTIELINGNIESINNSMYHFSGPLLPLQAKRIFLKPNLVNRDFYYMATKIITLSNNELLELKTDIEIFCKTFLGRKNYVS